MRTRFLPAASVAVLLCLTGCTSPASLDPEPTESYVSDVAPDEKPVDELVPNRVEPDTLLIVRALATAANGAELSLELQVHQSTRWDDTPSQTMPAAVIEDCSGLTDELFSAERWSFTRANLTAIPSDAGAAEWPADATVAVLPSGESVRMSGRGILAPDSSGACGIPTAFSDQGRGAIAFGTAGDADVFTAWANQRFGFSTGTDVALSECSVELTPLGTSLGGGAGWAPAALASDCSTGPAS